MKNRFIILTIFLFALSLSQKGFSRKGSDATELEVIDDDGKEEEIPAPWFTGPLLTPSGHVVPGGYINVEPYAFVNVNNGIYDRHWNSESTPHFYNVQFPVPVQIGILSWMDVQVVPQASYNSTQGVSSLKVNDFPIQLDFQLLHDTQENKVPGIKLSIGEIFPLGKYQKLDPERLGTDIGGGGSYVTTFSLVITRLFHLGGIHFLGTRLNPYYLIPSSVHVKGFNAYGGASDTKGKIRPGNRFGALLGLEYSMTQNWALAVDLAAFYTNKTRFSGRPGTTATGAPAVLKKPSSLQFSIAPAIEYNFNSSVGIIAGTWISFAGRNTTRFVSGVIAINFFGPLVPLPKGFQSHGGGGSGGSP